MGQGSVGARHTLLEIYDGILMGFNGILMGFIRDI